VSVRLGHSGGNPGSLPSNWNIQAPLELVRQSLRRLGHGRTCEDAATNSTAPDLSSLSSLASGLKDAGRAAGEAVKEQARQFATGVGDELQRTGEDQKARGVEALRGLAPSKARPANWTTRR
jgi:hypothetical protein